MNNKDIEKGKTIGTILIVAIIVFLVIKLGGVLVAFLRKFTQGLNITETEEEQYNEEKLTDIEKLGIDSNYWAGTYYKNVQSKLKNTEVLALARASYLQEIAKQIYDSIGLLYDNPEQTIGAIKKIKNKAQISQLAEKFNQMYQLDLLTFLSQKLDTNDQQKVLKQILNFTNSLKVGNQIKK
jgi:hypothetical protein